MADQIGEIPRWEVSLQIAGDEQTMPRFQKGQSGNPGGRSKGNINAFTRIKADFLWAFKKLGREHLLAFAQRDPSTFYRIIASLLPKEIRGEVGPHAVSVIISVPDEEEQDD
jgi:hypothetical protein